MHRSNISEMKPLIRGHIHLAAFFISLVACILLIIQSDRNSLTCSIIYAVTFTGLYGVSSLYHCPYWSRRTYYLLRKVDHAAIFALIAGTATPICLLGLKGQAGLHLFLLMWMVAIMGMIIAIFWSHAPKWTRAIFYVAFGWLAIPYFYAIKSALGIINMRLLLIGGIIYTVGALTYALKRPNPFPRVFGYHEIFHLFVVIASGLHFMVIYNLVTTYSANTGLINT